MKSLRWVVTIFIALALMGCDETEDCDPETDSELCGDRECGQAQVIDRCDEERHIECGECDGELECSNNECHCPGETQQVLCAQHELECGQTEVIDACDEARTIDCGDCSHPDDCQDHTCICIAQDDQQLCEQASVDCDTAQITDRCGALRDVDCGGCPPEEQCADNSCVCAGESDDELCAGADIECGSAALSDRCGDERTVDCGACSDPDECFDNVCECVGQSDDQLCDELDGVCGMAEAIDACGDERTVECEPCPSGDTTFGAVRDASSGALIDGAHIRLYEWPPSEGEHPSWSWPAGHRTGSPDFSTTTASQTAGDFNYEFATEESICMDDQVASLEPHQWYRIVVERSGYNPGIFYRRHGGYSAGDCPDVCPVTGGSGCHRQDFELWPSNATYPRRPALLADPRELGQNEWQCTLMPPDSPHDRLVGLRIRAGAANVGQGHFHLEATDTGGGQVVQHIHWSDGSMESFPINSEFEYHAGHRHRHFMNWFALRLLEPRDECLDPESRPGDCLIDDGIKVSFCLHDLEPFDGDIATHYDGFSSRFPDPPTCDTTEQGTTVAWKDTYNRHLPGQVVIVGPPEVAASIDRAWIEGEVDPDRVLEEQDRHGNVAHHQVDGPGSTSTLCSNPATTLDCSMPPDQYTSSQQHRQCGDYLEY